MFNSPILDVAIGLAFIFLLLSLLVTAICEMLAGAFRWRAENLWVGVECLLQSSEARDRLYRHPLVKGLAPPAKTGPSYIPSRAFALALIEVVREPHQIAARVRSRIDTLIDDAIGNPSAVAGLVERGLDDLAADPSLADDHRKLVALRSRIFAPVDPAIVGIFKSHVRQVIDGVPPEEHASIAAVMKWLDAPAAADYTRLRAECAAAIAQIVPSHQAAVDARARLDLVLAQFTLGSPEEVTRELKAFVTNSKDIRRALDNADPSLKDLVRSLSPLLDEAAGDIDRFRANIETWFNEGMDRVSGSYKRRTAAWQAGIGLTLAVLLNIDALLITRTLWRDPAVRQSIVVQAQGFASEAHPSLDRPPRELSSGGDAAVKVALSAVELSPGATLSIGVGVAGADRDRVVHIDAQGAYLMLSENPDQPAETRDWTRMLLLNAPKDTNEVHAFARLNGNVKGESLETFRVTVTDAAVTGAAGRGQPVAVSASVVARPAADEQFDTVRAQLGSLGLPIGWRACGDSTSELATPLIWCDRETWGYLGLLPMLLGWTVTAAAVSLGSPFWFDILKRFVSIRSTGKTPDERSAASTEPKAHA